MQREGKNGSKKVSTVRYLNVCVCECWLKLVFLLHFVYIFIRFAFLFELENVVAFCGFAGLMRLVNVNGKNRIIHLMHIEAWWPGNSHPIRRLYSMDKSFRREKFDKWILNKCWPKENQRNSLNRTENTQSYWILQCVIARVPFRSVMPADPARQSTGWQSTHIDIKPFHRRFI